MVVGAVVSARSRRRMVMWGGGGVGSSRYGLAAVRRPGALRHMSVAYFLSLLSESAAGHKASPQRILHGEQTWRHARPRR